jgi:hypothetical protein
VSDLAAYFILVCAGLVALAMAAFAVWALYSLTRLVVDVWREHHR